MPRLRALSSLLVGLTAATVVTTSAIADVFEGFISMRVNEGRTQHDLRYATKANHLRITMAGGPMGEAASIVDLEAGEIITLIPQMNSYMTIPFDSPLAAESTDADRASSHDLTPTGETTEILGYTCAQYLYEDDEGPVEIWATEQLGRFVTMPKGNPMSGESAPRAGWETALPANFFPMRLVAKSPSGRERMRWEVTAVQPQPLDDSLFEVPAGYQEFNLGGLMQGLGGLMGGN